MKLLRLSSLFLSSLLLAGCSTFSFLSSAPKQSCDTTNKFKLEAIKNWTNSGALAVTAKHPDGRNTGGNASFNWKQEGKQYTLELFGPFGINRVRLLGSPDKVTLFDGPGEAYTAATPEILLQQQLGWAVPVTHLLYWVRGLPAPHIRIEDAKKLPNGSFSQFTQDGWVVNYLDYTQVGCTLLPAKLSMQHPTLQVRLVIRQWQLQ
jgi:outer membrane lipoprotein LolB